MILIVGLGNPGTNYAKTRHNLGAVWVARLCEKYNLSLRNNSKLDAKIANFNKEFYCMISNSYMNHSGFSIQKFCYYHKFLITNVLVVHDELDLEPGDIRLKLSGGHGGHNGLKHIIEQLQSNSFKRLRIGIGHPRIKEQVTDYVLEQPSKDERIKIDQSIEYSWQIIPDLLANNWQKVMHCLHTPKMSGER